MHTTHREEGMAALRPDQTKTGAAAVTGTSGTQVPSRSCREPFNARASTRIDQTEFGVTAYRGVAGQYLDMTVEVRCTRA
jgi:hypothetical protein